MTRLRQGSGGHGPHRTGSGGDGPHRTGSGGHVAVLLSFPDDEAKARRRETAAFLAGVERDKRIIASCVELLNDLIASRPDGGGDTPALALARWITDAQTLLGQIKGEPAQIRAEVHVAELCLRLKGLVDEAELARFILVERALDTPPQIRVADLTLPQGEGGRQDGARRAPGAPVAALTADLVSDNLRLPAASPPSSSGAARSVKRPGGAGYPPGRFIARGPALAGGRERAGDAPHKGIKWIMRFFHALKMRPRRRAVSEKGKPGFSDREGRTS